MRRKNEKGQASVELALLFPLLFLFILLLVQVGLLVERQILVVHGAREGARMAAVDSDDDSVKAIVKRRMTLERGHLEVRVRRSPSDQTDQVIVRYRDPTDVPFVGKLLPNVNLSAKVTMRTESSR